MKRFIVQYEFDNGKEDYLEVTHNQISNAASKVLNTRWGRDELTGHYVNFDKVVKFSITERE